MHAGVDRLVWTRDVHEAAPPLASIPSSPLDTASRRSQWGSSSGAAACVAAGEHGVGLDGPGHTLTVPHLRPGIGSAVRRRVTLPDVPDVGGALALDLDSGRFGFGCAWTCMRVGRKDGARLISCCFALFILHVGEESVHVGWKDGARLIICHFASEWIALD